MEEVDLDWRKEGVELEQRGRKRQKRGLRGGGMVDKGGQLERGGGGRGWW